LTNPSAVRYSMLWHSEQKLSALQRWILIKAYTEIVESGSNEPKDIAVPATYRQFTF
jgi:hypothetical protein